MLSLLARSITPMPQFKCLAMIVVLLSVPGYGQDGILPEKADSIFGTWVRTQKQTDGSQISLMKIITPTHFAVFQHDSAKVKDPAKFQSHSGQYLLRDGLMLETYEFSSNPAILGQTGKCRVTVNNNKLQQTWTLQDGSKSIEEWERLTPSRKANTKE